MKKVSLLVAAVAVAMSGMVAVASAEPVMTATDAVRGVKHSQQVKPQYKKGVVRPITNEPPCNVFGDTVNKYL